MQKPWCIEIEPVEGCQLRCSFCGIHCLNLPIKTINLLDLNTYNTWLPQILELNEHPRIEFGGHGEPLLHPEIIRLISSARKIIPKAQLQLTSNGIAFLSNKWTEFSQKLLEAGLNILVISLYQPNEKRIFDLISENTEGWEVHSFIKEGQKFNPWYNHGNNGNHIVFMEDLKEHCSERRQRQIDNRAENAPDSKHLYKPINRSCGFPFRRLSIRWDGKVHVCCMDWGLEYLCGDANQTSLKDIWFGPEFTVIRKLLRSKQRIIAPCCRCDYWGGGRLGLLPDVGLPTKQDYELAKEYNIKSPRLNGREPQFISLTTKKLF